MAKAAAAQSGADANAAGLPAFLDAEAEGNAFLKAHKASLAKKWSLKAMAPLFDGTDLAFYLAALGRGADAAAIGEYLGANVSFAGNYNVWTPVGYAICLRARLLRADGKAAEADAALAPVIATPILRTPPQAQIDKELEALPGDVDKALAQSAKKAACSAAARKLYKLCWYLEAAHAKMPGYGGYALPPLEALWRDGMAKLAARLDS